MLSSLGLWKTLLQPLITAGSISHNAADLDTTTSFPLRRSQENLVFCKQGGKNDNPSFILRYHGQAQCCNRLCLELGFPDELVIKLRVFVGLQSGNAFVDLSIRFVNLMLPGSKLLPLTSSNISRSFLLLCQMHR